MKLTKEQLEELSRAGIIGAKAGEEFKSFIDDLCDHVWTKSCEAVGVDPMRANPNFLKPNQTKKLAMIGIRRKGERGFTIKVAE